MDLTQASPVAVLSAANYLSLSRLKDGSDLNQRKEANRMRDKFVRLEKGVIFKNRYGNWYLIDTKKPHRERFLITDGAEAILLSLFQGNNVSNILSEYELSIEQVAEFIDQLVDNKLVAWRNDRAVSTACFENDPPLDGVNLLLTNRCNLNCEHCYLKSGAAVEDELNGEAWINVLTQAKELGVFEINVSGGEPTLHPDFTEIAVYIASVPVFNSNLNTNGWKLTDQIIALIGESFQSVQVSLDSDSPELHNRFRHKKGCFEATVSNIRRLVESGLETNIGFTITPENISSLEGIIPLCEDLGVHTLNIGLVANAGRAAENELLPVMDRRDQFLDSVFDTITRLSHIHTGVELLLPFRMNEAQTAHCKHYICDGDNTQIAYVLSDGCVMPCDKLPKEHFTYGKIRQQTLSEIWNSEKMKQFKLTEVKKLPKCGVCPKLQLCGGACLARVYHESGSLVSCDLISRYFAKKLS